ncbi:MAG TPA: hypothetical protein VD793_04160 [Gemmatimonadales bacterium]|nr:hypothetical protein [Gemmatimonadales bacterium]
MKHRILPGISALILVAACGDGPAAPGGDSNSLTVSNAAPASGNGTLTNITVTVDENAAVAQGPAVYLSVSGQVGGVMHHFEVYILKSDNSLPNIEHLWGASIATPEGFTICDAGGVVGSPCAAAQVSASLTDQRVTFTGLALTAATGDGDLSTINGTLVW